MHWIIYKNCPLGWTRECIENISRPKLPITTTHRFDNTVRAVMMSERHLATKFRIGKIIIYDPATFQQIQILRQIQTQLPLIERLDSA